MGISAIDTETVITILKWSITILIAGFIAQFGKKLASYLIERFKQFKSRKNASGSSENQLSPGHTTIVPVHGSESPDMRRDELKYNKKMLKALAKERKKK
jgi:hypothetical protein